MAIIGYALLFSPASILAEDGIKYTAADGTVKTMSRAEAERKLSGLDAQDASSGSQEPKHKGKAYFDEDGRLIKSGGGVVDLSGSDEDELGQVSRGNVELAKFIAVGRFAQERLNDVGLAFGNLTGLKNSPRPHPLEVAEMEKNKQKSHVEGGEKKPQRGDAMRARMGRKLPRKWALSQVLTVREDVLGAGGEVVPEERRYETVVRYDESAFTRPYSALVSAWHILPPSTPATAEEPAAAAGGGGRQETASSSSSSFVRGEAIAVPPPPPKPEFLRDFIQTNKSGFVTMLGVILCAGLVKLIRTGIAKLLNRGATKRQAAGSGDAALKKKKTDGDNAGGEGPQASGESVGSGSKAPKSSGLKKRNTSSKKKSPKA